MNTDPKKLLDLFKPKSVKVVNPDRQMCQVRFGPDGKVLAAGCQDGSVRRWDASSDTLAELPPLTGHGGWVQAIAFHSDGKRLFAADSWGQLRCWSVAEKEPRALWQTEQAHDGWIRAISMSPDGKLLATCGMDRKIRLWSVDDGKKTQELAGSGEDVMAVAFHPDGKSIVSGDLKGAVQQWDLAAGKSVRDLDARILFRVDRLQEVGGVRGLVFDPAGKILACFGTQPKNGGNVQGTPTILLFDWASGKVLHTLQVGTDGDGYVYDVAFHPAGFVMAVSSGNPGTGKFFFHQPGDQQPFFLTALPNCQSLAVHPNGQRLVIATTNANSNGNGRQLDKNQEYPGNFSPLHLWDMPKPLT